MLPEIGHFFLSLAVLSAAFQCVGGFSGPAGAVVTRRATFLCALTLFLAYVILTVGYLSSDFSFRVVFENSHSTKPFIFKLSGVWGNHEGSALFWVLMMVLMGAVFGLFARKVPQDLKTKTLAFHGILAFGFLTYILFTSSPFDRLIPTPLDGQGLNPLLQDIGLAYHPPLLYLGYVGFSLVFSLALAALWLGRVDHLWARAVRPWALLAWIFLTAGLSLGSWWAYNELGWGGWWAWDPVENVAFMPWLSGTALLHSLTVVEKRKTLKIWTLLLAIATFSLSLIGTFLVRSGLLTSVHSFSSDPNRGLFILLLLALFIGGACVLFALRAPRVDGENSFSFVSRESALLLNNALLSSAVLTVFIGTFYPLFVELLSGERLSVGPQVFDFIFLPWMAVVIFAMALGTGLSWKKASLKQRFFKLRFVGVAVVLLVILLFVLNENWNLIRLFWTVLGLFLLLSTFETWIEKIQLGKVPISRSFSRARGLSFSFYGMFFAHLGFALMVLAMTATLFSQKQLERLAVGETAVLFDYQVRLLSFEEARPELKKDKSVTQNYFAERASLEVIHPSGKRKVIYPERRYYPVREQSTYESDVFTDLKRDFYVSLGRKDDVETNEQKILFQFYRKPGIPWLWYGSFILILGGGLSLIGSVLNRKESSQKGENHA